MDISSNDWFSVRMSMNWPGDGQSCGMLMPGDRSQSTASRSGSGYGSGLQQQRVDDAEDGRVGADADRQRRDDDERHARGFGVSVRSA